MKRWLAGVVLCGVFGSVQAADTILRLHGSNTIGAELAPALVQEWLRGKGYRSIRTETLAAEEHRILALDGRGREVAVEIQSHGSTTAFTSLEQGRADIGMASRAIKAAEVTRLAALGPLDRHDAEFVVGLDGVAVIVHPENPVAALDIDTLRDIFSGRVRDWAEIGGRPGPITVYARDDKSGTYDTFKSLVLGKEALSSAARRFESSSELSDLVAADASGIGFIGLPYVRQARALAVAERGGRAILPDTFSIATEDYALARRLYLYVPTRNSHPLAREFAEFAQAQAGQRIVEQLGFVSQNILAVDVAAQQDAPEEYRALTAGARRLSLNFRFHQGSAQLDSKAMRDLERLLRYMREDSGERRVMLFGFSDHNEVLPLYSLELSVNRVDVVADLLIGMGIAPVRVRGYGSALPVAANDSELGRRKNRRVEVWVQ
ncbi:MAG: phosphate ABC transporter substrate-binding/OmpA family protein [Thiohalomonadaceae bacterium]